MFPVASRQLTAYLASEIDAWRVSEEEVRKAREAVRPLQKRYQDARTGLPECVFESLLRCRLTANLMRAFDIPKARLPQFLNSSHKTARHVCIRTQHDHVISDSLWADAFAQQVAAYGRLIKIPPKGHKADLYLFATDGIVSLELKYVGPDTYFSERDAFEQMSLYRYHKSSLFVVYSTDPSRVEEKVRRFIRRLRCKGQRVNGLIVHGPQIARVTATGSL